MAMLNIYLRANDEAGYKATRFLKMLQEYKGLETARKLLHASNVSDGYTALWERGRLDLTVEALIIHEKWHPLFSEQEREIAWRRLREYHYILKEE
jgi:ABC-type molybdate transport system substrate-binding protein